MCATNRHPALEFQGLTYIRSVEESKALNERHEPMIIISASGMAETGRILHHLKNNIGDPRNTVMIVSWQAPDTLGRRLADGEKQVRIFGEPYDVRAEVVTIPGLSAHAGQDLLVNYAASIKQQVKKVIPDPWRAGTRRGADGEAEGSVGAGGVLSRAAFQRGLVSYNLAAFSERCQSG